MAAILDIGGTGSLDVGVYATGLGLLLLLLATLLPLRTTARMLVVPPTGSWPG